MPISVLCTPSYPFLEPTLSRMVPSVTFRVSQGLALPLRVALSPELQQWQSCNGPFTGLGTSPGIFLYPHGGLQALHKGKAMPLLCHQGNRGRRCSNLFVVGNLVPGCAGCRQTPGTSRCYGSSAHQHREHRLQLLGGSEEPFTQGWEKGEPHICIITTLQPAQWLSPLAHGLTSC